MFGPLICVAFLVGGTGSCVLVGGARYFPSDGRATLGGVFWGVCGVSMTLGSLSPDGLVCVPVFLVVWNNNRRLETAGIWVEPSLGVEMETSG